MTLCGFGRCVFKGWNRLIQSIYRLLVWLSGQWLTCFTANFMGYLLFQCWTYGFLKLEASQVKRIGAWGQALCRAGMDVQHFSLSPLQLGVWEMKAANFQGVFD